MILLPRLAFCNIGITGSTRLIQELFGRRGRHEAPLGRMPVESQGSTDPFVAHQHEGCCVHKRIRFILATLEQKPRE